MAPKSKKRVMAPNAAVTPTPKKRKENAKKPKVVVPDDDSPVRVVNLDKDEEMVMAADSGAESSEGVAEQPMPQAKLTEHASSSENTQSSTVDSGISLADGPEAAAAIVAALQLPAALPKQSKDQTILTKDSLANDLIAVLDDAGTPNAPADAAMVPEAEQTTDAPADGEVEATETAEDKLPTNTDAAIVSEAEQNNASQREYIETVGMRLAENEQRLAAGEFQPELFANDMPLEPDGPGAPESKPPATEALPRCITGEQQTGGSEVPGTPESKAQATIAEPTAPSKLEDESDDSQVTLIMNPYMQIVTKAMGKPLRNAAVERLRKASASTTAVAQPVTKKARTTQGSIHSDDKKGAATESSPVDLYSDLLERSEPGPEFTNGGPITPPKNKSPEQELFDGLFEDDGDTKMETVIEFGFEVAANGYFKVATAAPAVAPAVDKTGRDGLAKRRLKIIDAQTKSAACCGEPADICSCLPKRMKPSTTAVQGAVGTEGHATPEGPPKGESQSNGSATGDAMPQPENKHEVGQAHEAKVDIALYIDTCVGTMLDKFPYQDDLRRRFKNLPTPLRIGSHCTGSGAFELSCEAVADGAAEKLVTPVKFDTLYVGDNVEWKRRWLRGNILKSKKACCLTDITGMEQDNNGSLSAECVAHGTDGATCQLPGRHNVNGAGFGFSCTSWSAANSNAKNTKSALIDDMAEEASVKTFKGVLQLIDTQQPDWVILENTKDMQKEEKESGKASNLDVAIRELQSRNYSVLHKVLKSYCFGLPQRRVRLYFLCIRNDDKFHAKSPADTMDRVAKSLDMMVLPPPKAEQFLLDKQHPLCRAHLCHMQKNDEAKKDKEGTKWVGKHQEYAEKKGLRWPLKPGPKTKHSPWFQALSHRKQEVVIIGEMSGKTMLDASQSLQQLVSSEDLVPTLLPGSQLYHYGDGVQRILTGNEHLGLQGFPWPRMPNLSDFSNHQLADLAGNAMSLTVMAACVIAILGNMEYPSDADKEEAETICDLAKIMQSFNVSDSS